MIEIRNQTDFNALVKSTPTNQKIVIYPRRDGVPYTISKSWEIPSNTFIEGVNLPKIKLVRGEESESKLIELSSSSGAELKNIVIKNLYLIGDSELSSDITHGIYCNYVGVIPVDNYGSHSYDESTVGNEKNIELGVSIIDCYIEGFTNGIDMSNTHNSRVLGNSAKNTTTFLKIANNSSIIINNNTVTNCDNGFSTSINSRDIVFSNNKLANISDLAIYISDSKCINISSNSIENVRSGIYLETGIFNTISSNLIDTGTENGIVLSASQNNTITGNHIMNFNSGIFLSNMSFKNSITGNIVNNNIDSGITINESSSNSSISMYNSISNNTFTNNTGTGIILINAKHNLMSFNISSNNQKGHSLTDSDSNFIYGSMTYSNTEPNVLSGSSNTINTSENKFL